MSRGGGGGVVGGHRYRACVLVHLLLYNKETTHQAYTQSLLCSYSANIYVYTVGTIIRTSTLGPGVYTVITIYVPET